MESAEIKKLNKRNEQLNKNIDSLIELHSKGLINEALNSSLRVLEDLPEYYENSILEMKHDLLSLLFPEGFFYKDESIGTTQNATIFKVFGFSTMVSEGGLEPPRTIMFTRPSTLRVYQFRHSDTMLKYSI